MSEAREYVNKMNFSTVLEGNWELDEILDKFFPFNILLLPFFLPSINCAFNMFSISNKTGSNFSVTDWYSVFSLQALKFCSSNLFFINAFLTVNSIMLFKKCYFLSSNFCSLNYSIWFWSTVLKTDLFWVWLKVLFFEVLCCFLFSFSGFSYKLY